MYKEGQYYKNEYIKLCQYVQQCRQNSFNNKEHTNEAPLSSPEETSLRTTEDPSSLAMSTVPTTTTGEKIILNETIRLLPTFWKVAPMKDVFPGMFRACTRAETNIAAIGHRQITRLVSPTEDVVPGAITSIRNNWRS